METNKKSVCKSLPWSVLFVPRFLFLRTIVSRSIFSPLWRLKPSRIVDCFNFFWGGSLLMFVPLHQTAGKQKIILQNFPCMTQTYDAPPSLRIVWFWSPIETMENYLCMRHTHCFEGLFRGTTQQPIISRCSIKHKGIHKARIQGGVQESRHTHSSAHMPTRPWGLPSQWKTSCDFPKFAVSN